MSIRVRPLTPTDYPRAVEIENTNRNSPGTVEELEYFFRIWPEESPALRIVAELDGEVVGGANVHFKAPWMKEGDMGGGIIVHPDYRRRGVARALYTEVDRFIQEHQPRKFRTGVRDNQPESLAWAERRGFGKTHHIFDSTMNPSTFDETPFAGVVEESLASGIRYVHFNTIQTAETERKLHHFWDELLEDVPNSDEFARVPFDQWRKWMIESPTAWVESCILAVDQDGTWGGLTAMGRSAPRSTERAGIALTGVARNYRGRKLSLALKLVGIRFLKEHGTEVLLTNNHSVNQRMLATNRKLGYVPSPGTFQLIKEFQ